VAASDPSNLSQKPIDLALAERAVADLLRALGHDHTKHFELNATPSRVASAFAEDLLTGYRVDVPQLIEHGSSALDASHSHGLVVVRDISVATVCPHHLMPGIGSALVAYLPGSRLLGLGTVTKLVEAYAKRFALQEQVGQDVVAALMHGAGARGAYCSLTLLHTCLVARSQRQAQATLTTVASAGALAEARAAADLALALGTRGPI
jgi:GTP cyclohydrolase IA